MSLIRKPPTQAMVAANRANSLKCTGPVTDVGKVNVRLNALKSGIYSQGGSLMIPELGEHSGDLDSLRNKLRRSFLPSDWFEMLLVDQMLENRWRRQRVVRAEAGILLAQRLNFELDYARKLAGDGRSATSAGETSLAATSGLVALPDSYAKFNLILQCLRAAQEAVRRDGFGEEGLKRLETVYGRDPGLAGAALLAGYHHVRQNGSSSENEPGSESPALKQTFLEPLAAEIACFEKLLEVHEQAQKLLAHAQWETQNALSEADSKRITGYEGFLDRQFERLVKQFKEWRESHQDRQNVASPSGEQPAGPSRGSSDKSADVERVFGRAVDGLLKAAASKARPSGRAKARGNGGRPRRADRATKLA